MASTHDENSNTSMIESEYAENVSEYASDFPTAEDVKKRQRELNVQTSLCLLGSCLCAVPAVAFFYYKTSFIGGVFFALLTAFLAVFGVVIYAKDPRKIKPKARQSAHPTPAPQVAANYTYPPQVATNYVYPPQVATNYAYPLQVSAESYFDGGLLGLIGWYILGGIITWLSFGICLPWAVCMVYGWRINHTVINGRRLKFTGTALDLFGQWIIWLLLCFVTLGIYGFWVGIALEKWRVKHTVFETPIIPYEPITVMPPSPIVSSPPSPQHLPPPPAPAPTPQPESPYDFFTTRVAGVTFKTGRKSRQAILRRYFFKEPPFDTNECDVQVTEYEYDGEPAMGVYLNGEQVGSIPRDELPWLLENFHRVDRITAFDVSFFCPDDDEDDEDVEGNDVEDDDNKPRRFMYSAKLTIRLFKEPAPAIAGSEIK